MLAVDAAARAGFDTVLEGSGLAAVGRGRGHYDARRRGLTAR